MHKVGDDVFSFKASALIKGDQLNPRLHWNERYSINHWPEIGNFCRIRNFSNFRAIGRIYRSISLEVKRQALEPVTLPFDGVGVLIASGHIIMKHTVKRGGI